MSFDFSLILFSMSWRIYSVPKEPKYAAIFQSINNENQNIRLLCLSSRFMTYVLSFILGKWSPQKTPLKLGSSFKYLVILILLRWWSRTKNFYPYGPYYFIIFLVSWHPFLLSWLLFQLNVPFNNKGLIVEEFHLLIFH